MTWDIGVGETLTRREVHAKYGGQQQGGISTPTNSPNILIFTDPSSGKAFGYDKFEGLRSDENYAYTGEGQEGPQTFVRGNKALQNAAESDKTIRLFRTSGTLATYIGSFTLADPPYEFRDIPDIQGAMRQGIVFNLAPIDADTKSLPSFGGEILTVPVLDDWTPPESSTFEVPIPLETESSRTVSRVEFALQSDFGVWLRGQGHSIKRLRLPVGASIIEPDLYDQSTGQIFEAKKSSGRGYVRMAIGQVLDYVFCARKLGIDAEPAILLPGEPDQDLGKLCLQLGISVFVRDAAGFKEHTPH